jgi:glycerol-3-phosphate O-acyltransferase
VTELASQAADDSVNASLKRELGPVGRWLSKRYFRPVRVSEQAKAELKALSQRGLVVHVMRTTAWINFLYLAWAMTQWCLPPIRAVVNLRRWFTRPFTRAQLRTPFPERFSFAMSSKGSVLVFLRESAFNTARGRETRDDPFPALVALAKSSDKPIFLVPELFVWEKWHQSLSPSLFDRVFGSPEAPGFLHSVGAFLRNFRRAQFRVGDAIDLTQFVKSQPDTPPAVLARKVRSTLHHHLARETRAVFGPPRKDVDRLIEEAMRDRVFQESVAAVAAAKQKPLASIEREARSQLSSIAARFSPTAVGMMAPTLRFVFNRIYDGIEVDELGLERTMKAASRAPIVLTPSHKSHVDYLVMSYVLWQRGYTVPLVAAGANLSFFPLGFFLRRGGAFFLRRSFRGDDLYTASFKAYLKKLVHDGIHHEFFPEGGRSRTGKLMQPKLGLFTWLTDAWVEGARDDVLFVPVAIDYEKVVESKSYRSELKGGEKRPEDFRALLSAPKVLAEKYGRIHLRFDEPVSLAQLARERNFSPTLGSEDEKKGLVRALGHRIMFGIGRVSTVTPHALLASALLGHRRRGVSVRDVTDRVVLLRRMAEELGAPLSKQLVNAPSSPTVLGPIGDALRMFVSNGMVRTIETSGEPIFQLVDDRRLELTFYKNTLINLIAGRTIVCNALLASEPKFALALVREKALLLSRILKLEFVFPVGKPFATIFDETIDHLRRLGLLLLEDAHLRIAPEAHARPSIEFLSDLLTDFLESYRLAAEVATTLPAAGATKKDFLQTAMERGEALFHEGKLLNAESLSKSNLENALALMVQEQHLKEVERIVTPGAKSAQPLLESLATFLPLQR